MDSDEKGQDDDDDVKEEEDKESSWDKMFTAEEEAEKQRVWDEAFSDWTYNDYAVFVRALETHGR